MRAFPHSRAASFFIIRVCSGPLIFQRCLHLSTDLEQIGPGLLGAPQDGLHLFPLFKLAGQSAAIAAALAVTSFVMIPLHAYSISAVTGVLRAGGDVAWSAALDIAPQWLVALPLTALFALVFKSNYWLVAAAIQAESLLKVPLCALRIRTGKWIHDVTLPQGEL